MTSVCTATLRRCLRILCWLPLCLAPAARAADAPGSPYVAYRVELTAPEALRAPLRDGLDLFRWQDFATMTLPLLERLAGDARDDAGALLAARGYFSPQITSAVAALDGVQVVRLRVEPGPQTRVRAVSIAFDGAITGETEANVALRRAIRANWSLAPDRAFTQDDWTRAKQAALERMQARRYAGARITASAATIDPASQTAELALTLDSGPVMRFGGLRIAGLARHDPARVHHLWNFPAETEYAREVLDRFQRRLSATGYFASAQVDADVPDTGEASVPVRVALIEAPRKRLEGGLTYSTDTQFGASADYRDFDFLQRAWRLHTRLDLALTEQLALAEIEFPERAGGWGERAGLKLRGADIEGLRTDDLQLGFATARIDERRRPEWGVTFALSAQRALGVLSETAHATLFHHGYTWRTTDHLLAPRRGMVLQLEGGLAPAWLSRRAFARGILRFAGFVPLGPKLDLTLRTEAGMVLAGSAAGIPQSMLFRTGGSTTVRGYDFESLGVRRNASVLGGRAMLVGSVEVTRWIEEGLGIAAFADLGDAADTLRALRPVLGVGIGARALSPVGPIRADLAWGVERRELQLHFSVGLSF